MAINIPGNTNRKPAGVGLAFAGAGVVLVMVFLGAFFLSRSSGEPQQTYKAEDLTTAGVDTTWFRRDYPSTAATPTVSQPPPSTQPHVVVPQQVYRPAPTTTPDRAKQARMQALMRAMSSDIEVKLADSNVLETPQADPQQVAVKLTPAPPHTLLAWTWIDARLETPIDSDHGGDVLARVSHPARDLTQTEVLIPAGSLLHGTQQGTNRGSINDTSLVVAFDDLEFPNGAHLPLPKMNGMDTSGAPGLGGEVDRHLSQIWLPAVFTSAITAGIMLAQNPTYGSYQGYDSTQQASSAFASSMGSFATRALGDNLASIRPTVRKNKGELIRIMVNRDFTFPGPYQE